MIAGVSTATIGTGVVAVLLRRRQQQAAGPDSARSRWLSVTINVSPEDVGSGSQLPQPLAAFGDSIEVEINPAPGDKGAELRVRPRTPAPTGVDSIPGRLGGDDPRQKLRAALRDAKQLIETGEILLVDPAAHGHRPATPQGKLLDLLAQRAHGEGLV